MVKRLMMALVAGLIFGSVSAATPSFGRAVGSGFYDLITQDLDGTLVEICVADRTLGKQVSAENASDTVVKEKRDIYAF